MKHIGTGINVNKWNMSPAMLRNMAILFAVVALFVTEPAMAQAWAQKTNSVVDQIIAGLKLLGRGIAVCCIIWMAYQILWGGKRLQDMTNILIGGAIFLAGPEVAGLFFGS